MNIDIKIPPRHITGSTPGVRYQCSNNKKVGEQNRRTEKEKKNSIFLSGNKISLEGISVWGKWWYL
jgi:hypothetical protein